MTRGPAILTLAALAACASADARTQAVDAIRLNQVGYLPDAPKVAYVLGAAGSSFHVTTADGRDTVFTGALGPRRGTPASTDTTRAADFSALRRPGTYVVDVPGLGRSHPFRVAPDVYRPLAAAALKGFYFQRVSVPLDPRHAGPWAHPAGHPDTAIVVHPSAASPGRPAGTTISSPGGWYDAGDYNKYVVNSGISVATLLSLYEDFPAYARTLEAGIPESGDAVPDVLQEAEVNLRWMLTMQDPADGGVYHKLTEPSFSGMEMPHAVTGPRYVVQKSTAATLDFAAVAAQAARVYRPFDAALADSCLDAALRAWRWARAHPRALYRQDAMNARFDPDVVTGEYGDGDVEDERFWAAMELYVTTGADSFHAAVPLFPDAAYADSASTPPSWAKVRTLGYYTLARFRDRLPPRAAAGLPRVDRHLVRMAGASVRAAESSSYATPVGGPGDWIWGSSAVAANRGIGLVAAYRVTRDRRYLLHALAALDHLLGRNATGYSFVTGYGGKTPLHPHHRPSAADTVAAPVPGLLAGGPNPGRQDRADCRYRFTEPDRAYVDALCSYASNEIAINWNAPLVYLAAALDALREEAAAR